MAPRLLDTTFLIHHWGGRGSVRSYLESQPEGTEYLTTTIDLKEIAVGRKLVGEFDPDEIRSQFEWVRVVPMTPAIAWETAEIEAQLHRAEGTNRDRITALVGDALGPGRRSTSARRSSRKTSRTSGRWALRQRRTSERPLPSFSPSVASGA